MIAMRSWIALALLIGFSLPDEGMAARSAYAQTTEGLDLNRVQFVVSAPPEVTTRLSRHARSLFTEAGLPLPDPESHDRPFIAILTLTLAPQPLGEGCTGHLLYDPSLTLTEPVRIPRNSVILDDVTWLTHTGTQVRKSLTISDLESDLEELVGQFISDYRATNAGSHSPIPQIASSAPHPDALHSDAPATAPEALHSVSPLNGLHSDHLQISITAGRFSQTLTTRALQQFSNAGLALSPSRNQHGQMTLGVELIQQPLEDRCPGKVLYESGLYLVEQIQLTRNPRVLIWSDTWRREATLVVAPRSQEQLESDQDALLRQFIDSLKTH